MLLHTFTYIVFATCVNCFVMFDTTVFFTTKVKKSLLQFFFHVPPNGFWRIFSMLSNHTTINPRTYTHIHTPILLQGVGRGVAWNPSPEFLMCCSISKRFYLQWKAFNLLKQMRYLLWVVALPEDCDVTNNIAIFPTILDFAKN